MTTTAHKKTRTLHEDDPRHGATAQPALLMLLLGSIELIIWGGCNLQQITTTHDAIFGLLQGGTILPTNATAQQAVNLIMGAMDKNNKIAYTIAFVTQVIFLMAAFPLSHIWGRMAAAQGYHPSGSTFRAHVREVRRHLNVRRVIFIIFFIGDVLSDLRYVTISSREWMVPLFYILAMWAGSTLVGLDGWQRLSGVFSAWLSTYRYHAQPQGKPKDKDKEI